MNHYTDGSSATNCMCDGADDAMYTCEWHSENYVDEWELYFAQRNGDHTYDLVDAYGPRHYKTGVYDVC